MQEGEIDWEAEWAEFAKDKAFIGDPKVSKSLWIAKEKHKRGIPVEAPFKCYQCQAPVFHGCITYNADAKKHVSMCDECDKDPRHAEAFDNLKRKK